MSRPSQEDLDAEVQHELLREIRDHLKQLVEIEQSRQCSRIISMNPHKEGSLLSKLHPAIAEALMTKLDAVRIAAKSGDHVTAAAHATALMDQAAHCIWYETGQLVC